MSSHSSICARRLQEVSTVDIDSVDSGGVKRPVHYAQSVHMTSSGKPPAAAAASVARGSPATAALRQFVAQAHQDLNEVVPGSLLACLHKNLLV